MRKISLLLLFAACKLFSQTSIQLTNIATSATLAPNTVLTATTSANGTTQHSIDIKNVSASTKTIIIKRYDVLLFANITSTAFAVFNNLIVSTHTLSIQLTAGQSASQLAGTNFLLSEFYEADAVGHSIVKYTFFNTSTLSDSSQITLNFNPPTGLYQQPSTLSLFELFPNPVNEKGNIKINSEITNEGKLFIYNALGVIVNEKSVFLNEGENKLDFNTESLASGIYFLSLKFGASEITRKFAVN